MTITLDPPALRRVAHKLLDELLDKVGDVLLDMAIGILEPDAAEDLREPVQSARVVPPSASPVSSRRLAGQAPVGEVTVGCQACGPGQRSRRLIVRAPRAFIDRLSLKAPGPCGMALDGSGFLIVSRFGTGPRGRTQVHNRRVWLIAGTKAVGFRASPHDSESCAFQWTEAGELVITPPAWLVKASHSSGSNGKASEAPVIVSPPQVRSKRKNSGAPHCDVCQEVKSREELYECPTCTVLVCRPETSGCFDSHVRRCHHSKAARRAPVPKREEARV
jgi:hypothetical protein